MNSDDDVSAAAPGTAASTSASHSANPTRFTTLFYPIAANAQTDSEQPARPYCRGMVAAPEPQIRPCGDDEREAILAIVNAAAEAYRYAIPADRWHEPYMSLAELDEEIAAGALLERLVEATEGRILVGTWAAATWAVDFYRRHGFEQVSVERKNELLKTYWSIPERQIET